MRTASAATEVVGEMARKHDWLLVPPPSVAQEHQHQGSTLFLQCDAWQRLLVMPMGEGKTSVTHGLKYGARMQHCRRGSGAAGPWQLEPHPDMPYDNICGLCDCFAAPTRPIKMGDRPDWLLHLQHIAGVLGLSSCKGLAKFRKSLGGGTKRGDGGDRERCAENKHADKRGGG
ncbi:hypothetical protein DQ04_09041010 [Trypanosoma grayi]|uniref:hypothetical protein n=1 Tax=Trypanosoma grayi TaxID=71804 RepID=UPI0004F43B24|nr:hypothetical protein DQ04_09041010 [Trypanosoma grayi]KEG07703.1 hypothetical protein DQ04_09041010 [Trypanosoma grayi]